MSESAGVEQRRLRRTPGQTLGEIGVQCEPGMPVRAASVRNYSIQGMAILVDQAVFPGKQITVHLPHLRGGATIDAEVRHATVVEDGKWLLGCQLRRFLTVEDMLG
jgi:hypothetical protein